MGCTVASSLAVGARAISITMEKDCNKIHGPEVEGTR